jgi:glycosyltransferase 2 family protein
MEVLRRLAGMDLRWVAAAVLVAAFQVGLLAWQWRFTARRIGLTLTYAVAVREYWMAVFLNQVLPGGVLGDVSRAWRHGRQEGEGGSAFRAVLLERGSGQIVMVAVALASGAVLPLSLELSGVVGAGAALLALLAGLVALLLRRASPGAKERLSRTWRDLRVAYLSPRALPVQLGCSALAVASYLGVFLIAAWAVDAQAPAGTLLPLAAPVLVSMLIPVSVAGWGVREGAAALLWGVVGMDPSTGWPSPWPTASWPSWGAFPAPGCSWRGVGAELQVEEDVGAQPEVTAVRAEPLLQALDRLQGEPLAPGSDDERCNRDVETMKEAGL